MFEHSRRDPVALVAPVTWLRSVRGVQLDSPHQWLARPADFSVSERDRVRVPRVRWTPDVPLCFRDDKQQVLLVLLGVLGGTAPPHSPTNRWWRRKSCATVSFRPHGPRSKSDHASRNSHPRQPPAGRTTSPPQPAYQPRRRASVSLDVRDCVHSTRRSTARNSLTIFASNIDQLSLIPQLAFVHAHQRAAFAAAS